MKFLSRFWYPIACACLFLIALGLALPLPGCTSWWEKSRDLAAGATGGAKQSFTQAAGGYAVLDWIFVGCMIGAAVMLFLSILAPAKAKPWAIAGAVATGVSAIALKVLLVKFLPWIIGLSLGAGVISGLLFAYAQRWWLERQLHRDLDGDGSIGEPPVTPKKNITNGRRKRA